MAAMISSISGIRDGDLYRFQVFAGRAQVMSGIVSERAPSDHRPGGYPAIPTEVKKKDIEEA